MQLIWGETKPVSVPGSEKDSRGVAETETDPKKPVWSRSPKTSMISAGTTGPLKGGNLGLGLTSGSTPTERESEPLTLSPSPLTGVRGEVPTRLQPAAVSEQKIARSRSPILRPYQAESIASVELQLETKQSTLLVLPTGCGKTVVFSELTRQWVARELRTLVIAHRTELLDQAADKMRDIGLVADIDQGQRKASLRSSVVIASVQTLQRARLERYPIDHFQRIVIDEGHHGPAVTYGNVRGRFPSAKVLAVTATPDRGDGKGLGTCYETVAYTYEMRKAIAEGFLSPLRAKRILVEDLDLSAVKTRAGDFAQDELSKLLNDERGDNAVERVLVVELVFGVDVAHARALAETINRLRPGKAIALDGTSKPEERKAVLALFRAGKFQYLTNCALFTEGFDEPGIGCVALARPTQSRALYTQMLGRGTRLHPGKVDCLVLDFVGNSGRHRLIGPADALAGRDLDDKTRALVEQSLDGQLELEDVLAAAEEEAKKRVRTVNIAALTHYREREVDLFIGDLMPAWDLDCADAKLPATPDQLSEILLLKLGTPPHGLSKAEAAAMIAGVAARRRAGQSRSRARARSSPRSRPATRGTRRG
jgi:superfamily II DNA or RNA helicase